MTAKKTWEQMTLAEKVEDLRKDMLKTMDFLNHVARSGDQTERSANASKSAILGIADQIQKLELKVQDLGAGK